MSGPVVITAHAVGIEHMWPLTLCDEWSMWETVINQIPNDFMAKVRHLRKHNSVENYCLAF